MRTISGRLRLLTLSLVVLLLGGWREIPPLVEAAKKADKEAVRALVQQGVDVNTPDGDGSTALHWAAYWDDLESADLLLRAGAKANVANDLGATPLWAAAVNRSAAMTRRLLEAGADPKARLQRGETVLMAAARTGNPEVVKMLLDKGADLNARMPRPETMPCLFDKTQTCATQAGGQTALMWAVANQYPEVVALLLANGADVHARSDLWSEIWSGEGSHVIPDYKRAFAFGGNTPLIYAARNGDLASAKLLVAAGANVNDADAGKVSAMAIAAFADHGEIVRFLLESGADPNKWTSEFTPLHAAIMRWDEETVTALLAKGANPNEPLRGWTPVRRASIDFSLQPPWVGASPLWLAARFGTPNIMRQLVQRGADPHFVHESHYYGGGGAGGGGIHSFSFTQKSTILMAVLGMGGPGSAWVESDVVARSAAAVTGAVTLAYDAKEREARTLEAVKLAVDWGVDINATNDTFRTCEVNWDPSEWWAIQNRDCVEDNAYKDPGLRALDGAKALRYDSVIAYLQERGAIGSDTPIEARPAVRVR